MFIRVVTLATTLSPNNAIVTAPRDLEKLLCIWETGRPIKTNPFYSSDKKKSWPISQLESQIF